MKAIITAFMLVVGVSAHCAWADEPPAPTGNFMSSLKQSFQQNYDNEIVRGHFDLGTAPDAHRYYCLINPNNGKAEANGVVGAPKKRRDGTTGIQGAAVSFYNCADAEAKGLLVTTEYQVTLAPGVHAQAVPAPAPAPAQVSTPPPSASASTLSTPSVADDRTAGLSTGDPMSTLVSFIGLYNSGDGAALASLLGESADFAWVQPDGRVVWGHRAALEALQASHAAGSQLLLESQEGHPLSLAPKTVVLITKLRLTQASGSPRTIHCSSVLLQTAKGWRIASLFMTAEAT